ncbi:tRNA1(Val) A37 N6-methylase TrmN6 [Pilibacter termitis]|uniref:tRNA1(Val) A37 N6-methylase TrmN6 n=1 Tax=Pilibacter termitis TaxID=263852 RepID=A0A1T4R9V1_9ENTE|nr:tRNA1(Val) (adenine(37)-N6)-methyltransferase [Pilibacter termitis]SKA12401.1 tRNA1(Val) A37 N6-methylase TrmN6 [Pilibacter termitis]
MVKLYDDERVDQLFAEDIKVIQSSSVFSYSIDSILLANFPRLPQKENQLIVDLCAGNGAVGLFASKKTKTPIVQIEIQERLADMARRSVELNNLEHQITVHTLDLKESLRVITHDSADMILVNPPYFKHEKESKKNPNPYFAIARHEISATLEDIVKMSSVLLKTNGRLAMVHRPDRLLEIFDVLRKYKIAPKRVQFIYPKKTGQSNTVLIEGIKNGSTEGLRILPPLVVHDENGEYTKEAMKIYYGN